MNKIKISHEAPLSLMEYIEEYNSYQYCLPHLMDQSELYKNLFLRYKNEGKEIYLDNSLHELGNPYDSERLFYWIDILRPSNFFVPDFWEDKTKSIVSAREWSKIELPPEVTKVAVVQATTLHEAFECVQTYKDLGYKKIAFSYGASYYNDICPHPNKDMGKALGRLYVISTLYNQGMLKSNDRVHLLGTAIPQEFGWYNGIECIESIDTSNPVMATIEGMEYTSQGLTTKPTTNLNSCFDENFDIDEWYKTSLLLNNLKKFREINGFSLDN